MNDFFNSLPDVILILSGFCLMVLVDGKNETEQLYIRIIALAIYIIGLINLLTLAGFQWPI